MSDLDLASGKVEALLAPAEPSAYRWLSWKPDGSGFYLVSDHERDLAGLAFYDMTRRSLQWIATPASEVEAVDLSADGRYLVWSVNTGGFSQLHLTDVSSERPILANSDPDVMFFRSKNNRLQSHENQLLEDLGILTGFKATSDLPRWMAAADRNRLRVFLAADPTVQKGKRYCYRIGDREADFSSVIPIPAADKNYPVWLARNLGLLKIVMRQALPAIFDSLRN